MLSSPRGDALFDVGDVEDGVGVDEDAQHRGGASGGDYHDASQKQGNEGFFCRIPPRSIRADGYSVTHVGVKGDDSRQYGAREAHEGDGINGAVAQKTVDATRQGK